MTGQPTDWIDTADAAELLLKRSQAMNDGDHVRMLDADNVVMSLTSFSKLLVHLTDPADVMMPIEILAATVGRSGGHIQAATRGGVSADGKVVTPPFGMVDGMASPAQWRQWRRDYPDWVERHARNVKPKTKRARAISQSMLRRSKK